MLTQPADEIGRVYPVNAKTQSCPTSCRETLEVEAAAAVVESCDAVRPQGPAAACIGKGSATAEQKAKCAAAAINPDLWGAGEPTVAETDAEKNICWDASKDAMDATYSHCIYLEQLSCGLNRVTPDAAWATDAQKAFNLADGFTCDAGLAFDWMAGECEHVLPKPAIVGADAKCEISAQDWAPSPGPEDSASEGGEAGEVQDLPAFLTCAADRACLNILVSSADHCAPTSAAGGMCYYSETDSGTCTDAACSFEAGSTPAAVGTACAANAKCRAYLSCACSGTSANGPPAAMCAAFDLAGGGEPAEVNEEDPASELSGPSGVFKRP
jgi:hypothetical protein